MTEVAKYRVQFTDGTEAASDDPARAHQLFQRLIRTVIEPDYYDSLDYSEAIGGGR